MDTITELTCPECGEQQTQAEACISCGTSLLGLSDDIPTMQGKKTVSIPWPTESSPKSTSSKPTAETNTTQIAPSRGETLATATETQVDSNNTEESAGTAPPEQSINWQPLGDEATTEKVESTEQETSTPHSVILPWQAISNLENLESSEAPSSVEATEVDIPSDSANMDTQADGEPPAPETTEKETDASLDRVRHPLFWGTGRSLFGIFIVNTFLTLITVGIYSFWGRARVRHFLNSQTSFAGARFSYHGTGKELFTGWMKAMLVFGLPYLFLSSLPFFWHSIPAYIPQAVAGLLVLGFIPVAVVGAHRYRLSRTSLRNIRFSFRGTVSDYTKLWLKGSALTVLTLGIYYPFFENARRHYLVTHSQFGSHGFDYDGTGKELLTIYSKATGIYLATILVSGGATLLGITSYLSMPIGDMKTILFASSALPIITMAGLIVPWFYLQAARQRYFWNHTLFGESRFHSSVTAWKIFELRLGHLMLLISTLGLSWPWVQVRNLQFFYYYTSLDGPINLHRVEQDALDASPTGEELAGFFDTGFDLG